MSTLRTEALANSAGSKSVPIGTVVDGTVKAWVSFNGTGTVAIRAAFNVTSITDNGTGSYNVNFTVPMPDVNYSVAGSGNAGAADTGILTMQPWDGQQARTTSSVRVATAYVTSTVNRTLQDCIAVDVIVNR